MLKYNYRLGINYFNVVYAANKDAFASLPPKIQSAVKAAVARLAPSTTSLMDGQEDKTTDALAKGGMQITKPTPEELQAAIKKVRPYWEEWAAARGPDAVEALGKIRKALGR